MKVVFTSERLNTIVTQELSPMFEYVEVSAYEIAEVASLKASKVWGVSPLWEWSDCVWEVLTDD